VDWWRDLLDQNTLVVVEWSDRIQPHLPVPRLEIQFIITDENERKIIINEIQNEKK
jgi:tRNA A37 threonylcarbamoyladenosine biosynthesis protein TsaE